MHISSTSWVKSEIDQTLNRAQAALESYAENHAAVHYLRTCAEHLHEVTGTLRIVEIQGGILLAEEMEQLVSALSEGRAESNAIETLMRVILQLPDYLERLQSGARDLPIALLPLLNELRAARGESLLTADLVFFPDLTSLPISLASAVPAAGIDSIAKRARFLFQSGLVAWYRNPEDRDVLQRLAQALEQLRSVATHPETVRLWWIGAGLIEALQDNALDIASARGLLGKLDRQIKRIIDSGEAGIITDPPLPFLRQILYYLAVSSAHGQRVQELRDAFHLDTALPSAEDLTAIRNTLRGANRAVMATVAVALHEDLTGVMDSLDLFVRSHDHNVTVLQPLVERLRQIAGTLTVIDQETAQNALLIVAETITNLQVGNHDAAALEEIILNLASRLVRVESIIAALSETSPNVAAEGTQLGFAMDERHLHKAVFQQALNSLTQAKEAITAFAQDPIPNTHVIAQTALNEVAGGLAILNLDRPCHLVDTCARVLNTIASSDSSWNGKSAGDLLDHLAVAIAALEFYLEEQSQERNGDSFLAQGEAVLATLTLGDQPREFPHAHSEDDVIDHRFLWNGSEDEVIDHPFPWDGEDLGISTMLTEESSPTSTSAATPPSLLGVDDEMVEVFAEETIEEMANLDRHLPRLRMALSSPEGFGDRDNQESLRTVRRSFHTLKGSGRMVGATRLGDLAWAVENLLNRIIDGTVAASPDLLQVMEDARLALPALVADFRAHESSAQGIEAIAEQAWRLAHAGPSLVHKDADVPLISSDSLPVMDPMLLELFTTETQGHLLTVETALKKGGEGAGITAGGTALKKGGEGAGITAGGKDRQLALSRALHTLQGSARMAQIDGIAIISRAMEHYVRAHAAANLPLDAFHLRLLEEGVELIRAWLAALAGRSPPPNIDPWLALIKETQNIASLTAGVETQNIASLITSPAIDGTMQLFLEEAMDSLKVGEQAVSAWQAQPNSIAVVQALRLVVKTLGNSAELAGIPAITTLCRAMYDVINRAVDYPRLRSEATARLFAEAIERIWVMLESLRDYQPPVSPDDLCAALAKLIQDDAEIPIVAVASITATPSKGGEGAGITAGGTLNKEPERGDLLEMFLAEAEDLMGNLDNLLQQLSVTPTNVALVGELRRNLHTLKGGARMVGVQAIADLAHALESMINNVVDGHLPATQRLFDILQVASDHLARMLDQVRAGLPVEIAIDLYRLIDNLVNQHVHDQTEDAGVKRKTKKEAAETTPPVEIESETEPSFQTNRRSAPRIVQEHVRVAADLLNQLVNHAAEVSITRSRVDQQLAGLRHSLHEMAQTVSRLRDQWRKLEIETEAQIFHHHEESGNADFDPLELDRYSTLQQLSRSLMESVSDLASLHGLLTVATRDAEMLLLQQSRITKELQEGLMRTRMVPFAGQAQRLRRIVRQTAQELNIQAELHLVGADLELDRTVLDRMVAPLEHMLRNAVSHGLEPPAERHAAGKPESGLITITLYREGQEIVIKSRDDGRGLNLTAIRRKAEERGLLAHGAHLADKEVMQFILEPGFSTASQVTQISGRGVGMDVVSNEVKLLGGNLDIDSEAGRGTTFTVHLPLTLAVNKALLVNVQGDLFAIPLVTIRVVLQLSYEDALRLQESSPPNLTRGGINYQFIHAASLLDAPLPPHRLGPGEKLAVLLFEIGDLHTALAVDGLLGAREIVVKSVGAQLGRVREISGATILGDGRVVIILDMAALIRKSVALHGLVSKSERVAKIAEGTEIIVLVVDDSITVRKVTARLLERHQMTVFTARDGVDAVALLQKHIPDLIIMDIEMPRMDGYELTTYVRGEPRLREIPIIMITSRTGNKHRERAAQVGVTHYLGKPYQETELLEVIQHLRIRSAKTGPGISPNQPYRPVITGSFARSPKTIRV